MDYTKHAELIPSAQFLVLSFVEFIKVPESLPIGSYIISDDTKFLLAEPVSAGSTISYIITRGFKAGDSVVITHKNDPLLQKRLTIKSISSSNWKTLEFDSFQVSVAFPAGSIISTENEKIKSTLQVKLQANKDLEEVEITGFSDEDNITLTRPNDEDVVINLRLTKVERYKDRVYLDENYLPWYVEV